MSRERGSNFSERDSGSAFEHGLPLSIAGLIVGTLLLFVGAAALSADYSDYTACDADLNDDRVVNFLDLAGIAKEFLWDCSVKECTADINQDGDVNLGDLAIMKHFFFQTCRPPPNPCPPCKSYFDGEGTYGQPDFVPGTCPKVVLEDGTVCNDAVTSITIKGLPPAE